LPQPASDPPTPRFIEPKTIFLEARYCKFARDLPQTIFYCPECKGRGGCERCEGFGKLTKDSVQELVGRVAMPRFKARRNKFHGAGREDMDVLMLGEGRPFVVELVKSKRHDVDLEELTADINRRAEGRMEISLLQLSSKARVVELKEAQCSKEYRAQLAFEKEVDLPAMAEVLLAQNELLLQQRTPTRVAHRRGDLVRERKVKITGTEIVDGLLWVQLDAEHGTYIKEFISGDDGRTVPSLTSLLGETCSCAVLDVLRVNI
jgi:tRNA pseudouridine synthase 10